MKIGSAKHKPESAGKAGMPGQSESGGYIEEMHKLIKNIKVSEPYIKVRFRN